MSETVLMNVEEGVALLTLNRPDRLNAWTPELGSAYFDHLEACAADPDVRVIVVTGEGRGFCAGADMQDLEAIGAGEIDQAERRQDERPQSFPSTIPKPIIAAINGPVAGIGLALALWCDIRFIADEAKVTTAFARRGLIGEYGMAWILPRASWARLPRWISCSRGGSSSARRPPRWASQTAASPRTGFSTRRSPTRGSLRPGPRRPAWP